MDYIQKLNNLVKNNTDPTFIQSKIINNIFIITFNRPNKANAFTYSMYVQLNQLLLQAQTQKDVIAVIIKGNGKNFSSGNDLSNFLLPPELNISQQEIAKYFADIVLKPLILTLIHFQKPIIAQVQGNVIGFAVTMLGLCDLVYSVKGSKFVIPMVNLGQGPEFGAAFTLVQYFGYHRAYDVFVNQFKVEESQLLEKGYINECFNTQADLDKKVNDVVSNLSELSTRAVQLCKGTMRNVFKQTLLNVVDEELKNLVELWSDPNLINYLGRRPKL